MCRCAWRCLTISERTQIAGGQPQTTHDLLEKLFESNDRVEVVGRRIETDDDVTAAVGEPLQDREQDFVLIVARAVRLDAGPEVVGRADRRTFSVQRVEERARHRRELVVGHDLDDGRNRFTGQRVLIAPRPCDGPLTQQRGLHLGHRQRVQLAVEPLDA